MAIEERVRNFFHALPLGTTFKQAEEAMLKAITEAIAEERERCAKVVDCGAKIFRGGSWQKEVESIAAAIRKGVKP